MELVQRRALNVRKTCNLVLKEKPATLRVEEGFPWSWERSPTQSSRQSPLAPPWPASRFLCNKALSIGPTFIINCIFLSAKWYKSKSFVNENLGWLEMCEVVKKIFLGNKILSILWQFAIWRKCAETANSSLFLKGSFLRFCDVSQEKSTGTMIE